MVFSQTDRQSLWQSHNQVYKGCDPKNRLTKHVAFPQTDRQGLWCSHRQRKPSRKQVYKDCIPTNRPTKHVAFPQIDSHSQWHFNKQTDNACGIPTNRQIACGIPTNRQKSLWQSHKQKPVRVFSFYVYGFTLCWRPYLPFLNHISMILYQHSSQ